MEVKHPKPSHCPNWIAWRHMTLNQAYTNLTKTKMTTTSFWPRSKKIQQTSTLDRLTAKRLKWKWMMITVIQIKMECCRYQLVISRKGPMIIPTRSRMKLMKTFWEWSESHWTRNRPTQCKIDMKRASHSLRPIWSIFLKSIRTRPLGRIQD